jgi:hypothetical protein
MRNKILSSLVILCLVCGVVAVTQSEIAGKQMVKGPLKNVLCSGQQTGDQDGEPDKDRIRDRERDPNNIDYDGLLAELLAGQEQKQDGDQDGDPDQDRIRGRERDPNNIDYDGPV